MALRLPDKPSTFSRRQSPLLADSVRALISAVLLVLFGLRVALLVMGIPNWTVSWKIIAILTAPISWPVSQITPLETAIIQRLTVGDAIVFLIVAAVATYLLATLTVRRLPHTPG